MTGWGYRLQAILRALFGPQPGPQAQTEQDARRVFDERWHEQEAALDILHAEAELSRRRHERQREDVQGYGGPVEGESE